jgi:hypothetical protein
MAFSAQVAVNLGAVVSLSMDNESGDLAMIATLEDVEVDLLCWNVDSSEGLFYGEIMDDGWTRYAIYVDG